jgi:glycosyltransferase involved in cell wall biosynthesis
MYRYILISGAIICRNNQETVLRAISSFHGLCDEIIVVDTGSTDGTLDRLKGLNIKLYETNWEKDFSKARNYAIGKCSGDWILFLDSDEWIDSKGKVQIKSLIEKDADCWEVIQLSYLEEGRIMCPTVRLFKKGLRYNLPIHESLIDSIRELGYKVGKSNVVVHHSGWHDESQAKKKRNFELIKEDHPLYNYYFGMISEGEEKEKKLMLTLKQSSNKYLNAYIYNLLADYYLEEGLVHNAITCCELSLEIEKRQNLAFHLLQKIYLKIGLVNLALENLEKLLDRADLIQCYVVNDRLFEKDLLIQSINELKEFQEETLIKLKGN